MPFGVPARLKISSKSAATLSPLTVSLIFRPMHSQSSSRIAAPLFDSASSLTLKTTSAFLVPMSMEWPMIASQGESIALTWLISPKPGRNVQLMTEVKCGTQPSPDAIAPPSKSSIRGTLRYDTTACTTSKTHNARTSAGWSATTLFTAGSAAFFFLGRLPEFFDLPLQFRDSSPKPLFGFSAVPKFIGAGHRLVFPRFAASYEF